MKRYVVELANDIIKEADSAKIQNRIVAIRNAYIAQIITTFEAVQELSGIWYEIRNGGKENE